MLWNRKQKFKKKIIKAFTKIASTLLILIVFIAQQAQLMSAFEAHVINVTATIENNVCPGQLTLDFDKDAAGNPILKGQFIDNEYLSWGIQVFAHNYNISHPQFAIAFDSANPSGGINGDMIIDVDLGTSNIMYGGPGLSETGDNTEPSNDRPLKNLLIIPDNKVDTTPADGYVDDPNDEPAGGSLRFIFDREYTFSSVKYIDLDWSTGEVVGYSDAAGTAQVFSIPVPKGKGNSVQTAKGDETTPIRYLKLRGRDSYAVDEVKLCPVPEESICGDGKVNQPTEECDDGNTVNGDGCDNDCKVSSYCGDGIIKNPNSYGQAELCDDGVRNGTEESQCTRQCAPKTGQCDALSPGYYKNNDGCQNGTGSSIWSAQVNTLSDSFFDVFLTIDGAEMCQLFASNCNSGTATEKALCKAKQKLLADEANIVKSRLLPNALLAWADDGDISFDALGLSATSTIAEAISAVENVIADASATEAQLKRAFYVAGRIYTWYEKENFSRPECVMPGMGNAVLEQGEQCDDGNLIPEDGCSPDGKQEIVLNEILPNPVGDDNALKPQGEWVELYNLTNKPISLKGWALYDADNSHELLITDINTDTGTTTIQGLDRLVVYRNGDTDFSLNNTGDTVRLLSAAINLGGGIIDQFTYTSGKSEGLSFARVPDGTGNWVDPCPTPGDENTQEPCLIDAGQEAIDQNQAIQPILQLDEEGEEITDAAELSWDELEKMFSEDGLQAPLAQETSSQNSQSIISSGPSVGSGSSSGNGVPAPAQPESQNSTSTEPIISADASQTTENSSTNAQGESLSASDAPITPAPESDTTSATAETPAASSEPAPESSAGAASDISTISDIPTTETPAAPPDTSGPENSTMVQDAPVALANDSQDIPAPSALESTPIGN